MESYRVSIRASAAKELEALPTLKDRQRAVALIRGLATEPRPRGCIELAGTSDAYRVRFGSYRILYSISDRVRVVSIERTAHRREAYR